MYIENTRRVGENFYEAESIEEDKHTPPVPIRIGIMQLTYIQVSNMSDSPLVETRIDYTV